MSKLSKYIQKKFSSINIQKIDIHDNLKKQLIQNKIFQLNPIQKSMLDHLNTSKNCLFLSDCGSGKSIVSVIYTLNKLLNENERQQETVNLREGEVFLNSQKIFDENKRNIFKNRKKKSLLPKGILYFSPKFEFLTNYYRQLRLMDPTKSYKFIRLGCSLQATTPIVEHMGVKEFDARDLESFSTYNLVNNTDWSDIDILLVTPFMFDHITKIKDSFDPYDINPEIIIFDDFDFLFSVEYKEIILKILRKYFSKKSELNSRRNTNTDRQLVFLSSTSVNQINEEITNTVKNWFSDINILSVLNSKNKDISSYVTLNLFNFSKSTNDEHFRNLIQLIMSNLNQMILICCKENRISSLVEYLNEYSDKINFKYIEKNMEITSRLSNISEFKSRRINVLISNISFLIGMDFENLDHIIIFDELESKDFIRLVGRLNRREVERKNDILSTGKQSISIFYKSNEYIENLKNNFPFIFQKQNNNI